MSGSETIAGRGFSERTELPARRGRCSPALVAGTRTTVIIPASQVGNERPIEIVSERWYSPQLKTVVMTSHKDPRMGETTYRLTNISMSEPARNLFEVPAGYAVTEENPMKMRGLRKPEQTK